MVRIYPFYSTSKLQSQQKQKSGALWVKLTYLEQFQLQHNINHKKQKIQMIRDWNLHTHWDKHCHIMGKWLMTHICWLMMGCYKKAPISSTLDDDHHNLHMMHPKPQKLSKILTFLSPYLFYFLFFPVLFALWIQSMKNRQNSTYGCGCFCSKSKRIFFMGQFYLRFKVWIVIIPPQFNWFLPFLAWDLKHHCGARFWLIPCFLHAWKYLHFDGFGK